MSTGKRLAKRSIIGTRVCAPGDDGKYYSGVIQAVKTPGNFAENSNCINLTPNTRYTVKFDLKSAVPARGFREYRDCDLIGPGFRSISGVNLQNGQKVYLTFNGREVSGEVMVHHQANDEVVITAFPPGHEVILYDCLTFCMLLRLFLCCCLFLCSHKYDLVAYGRLLLENLVLITSTICL